MRLIDTNVLISSLYRLAIRRALFARACPRLSSRYAPVLARPKFAFPPEEIKAGAASGT